MYYIHDLLYVNFIRKFIRMSFMEAQVTLCNIFRNNKLHVRKNIREAQRVLFIQKST